VLYEAALTEGADHAQAMMLAMGKTPELLDTDISPLGWYRAPQDMANAFCYAEEQEETDNRVEGEDA